MLNRSNLKIACAVLVLMVAQAHCQQLMCYICENCAQITENTPKEVCDESFFNKVDTTPPSTTTIDSAVTTETIASTTTKTVTSTEESPITTETPASTKSPIPTAGTAGPPQQSTTVLPTPTNHSAIVGPIIIEAEANNLTTPVSSPTTTAAATSSSAETTFLKPLDVVMQPAQLRVRQLRSVTEIPTLTYHCYTVQRTLNDTLSTSRGCSRINQTEAVCPQLELASNTTFSQCMLCSNTLCNSSSAVGVSAVAVILGLVAAFLLGFPA